ncbi:MAG: hypothetical protein AAF063_05550 [Cyanobacteria bacterium J06643_5]
MSEVKLENSLSVKFPFLCHLHLITNPNGMVNQFWILHLRSSQRVRTEGRPGGT